MSREVCYFQHVCQRGESFLPINFARLVLLDFVLSSWVVTWAVFTSRFRDIFFFFIYPHPVYYFVQFGRNSGNPQGNERKGSRSEKPTVSGLATNLNQEHEVRSVYELYIFFIGAPKSHIRRLFFLKKKRIKESLSFFFIAYCFTSLVKLHCAVTDASWQFFF